LETEDFSVSGRESLHVDSASQEKLYTTLVQRSWRHFHQRYLNQKLDDVVVGAVIAAAVNQNFQLIDLQSDGTNHYLRFEELETPSRVLFRLRHLSDDFVDAQVQGHLADVIIGYGEPTHDLEELWKELRVDTLQAVLRVQEPGVILFEADLVGKYLYAQVPLLLELDRYLVNAGPAPEHPDEEMTPTRYSSDEGLRVNLPRLVEHVDAVVHSLKIYLQGRIRQLRQEAQ
jgi:hypothetical protein